MDKDTIRLLRECDAGVKMGVAAIDEVASHTCDQELRRSLRRAKDSHQILMDEVGALLNRAGKGGKNPSPMARGMSAVKTNAKLAFRDCDKTVADLITDGCNMGVKSLSRYLNQYPSATDDAKRICRRIIRVEQGLCDEVRPYL